MLKLLGCNCNGNVVRGGYIFLCGFRHVPLLYSTSTCSNDEGNPCSFANFLVNSLGFSDHQSLSTSAKLAKWRHRETTMKLINFNFVDNAHFVIDFLKQLGYQQSHIQKIVCYDPRILVIKRVGLESKIDLLLELGISGSDLVQLTVKNPSILYQPLYPAIHALRAVFGRDDDVVRILKRISKISLSNIAKYLVPNAQLWQDYCRISSDKIKKYILQQPKPFTVRTELFRDILMRVEEKLGIPRQSAMFMYGIQLLSFCNEKNLEDRCAVFKSFGWTQFNVTELIRRNPLCFSSSEKRINEKLDFLMNHLGYKPNDLAMQPSFFTYSLGKRLLPRHRVLQVLKEKGLLRRGCSLYSATNYTEAYFIAKFVLPFNEVHEIYARLTSSTLESLNVGRAKANPKDKFNSDSG